MTHKGKFIPTPHKYARQRKLIEQKKKYDHYDLHSKYDDKYADMLLDHLNKGGRFEDFAVIAGVTTRTLYNWADNYPSFFRAKELGEMGSFKFWLDVGRAGLTGQLRTITKEYKTLLDDKGRPVLGPDGQPQQILIGQKDHPASFNASAWIFTMKNRFGWRDQRVIEHTGEDGGKIKIQVDEALDHLSEEELLNLEKMLIKVYPNEIERDDGDEDN